VEIMMFFLLDSLSLKDILLLIPTGIYFKF
jgi:hypothetical protein